MRPRSKTDEDLSEEITVRSQGPSTVEDVDPPTLTASGKRPRAARDDEEEEPSTVSRNVAPITPPRSPAESEPETARPGLRIRTTSAVRVATLRNPEPEEDQTEAMLVADVMRDPTTAEDAPTARVRQDTAIGLGPALADPDAPTVKRGPDDFVETELTDPRVPGFDEPTEVDRSAVPRAAKPPPVPRKASAEPAPAEPRKPATPPRPPAPKAAPKSPPPAGPAPTVSRPGPVVPPPREAPAAIEEIVGAEPVVEQKTAPLLTAPPVVEPVVEAPPPAPPIASRVTRTRLLAGAAAVAVVGLVLAIVRSVGGSSGAGPASSAVSRVAATPPPPAPSKDEPPVTDEEIAAPPVAAQPAPAPRATSTPTRATATAAPRPPAPKVSTHPRVRSHSAPPPPRKEAPPAPARPAPPPKPKMFEPDGI